MATRRGAIAISVASSAYRERLATDEAKHETDCEVCREGLKPGVGELVVGIKNASTREYRHLLCRSVKEAKQKVGWEDHILFAVITERGKQPMPEGTKEYFRKVSAERKSLRRSERKGMEKTQLKALVLSRRVVTCSDGQAVFRSEKAYEIRDPQGKTIFRIASGKVKDGEDRV